MAKLKKHRKKCSGCGELFHTQGMRLHQRACAKYQAGDNGKTPTKKAAVAGRDLPLVSQLLKKNRQLKRVVMALLEDEQ